MSVRVVGWAAALSCGLAACAGPPPASLTERDSISACRQRADQVYDRLNRRDIYSGNQDNLAPNSSVGLLGNPTGGLSQQYAHERMIETCVRDTGAGSNVPGSSPSLSTPVVRPGRAPAR
ncbi:MAG: hypothetical protein M3Y41_14405 [Pseudomonadota bacterium]|nr:hypothetical protein [Pseudomonadota bacterium]